MKKFIITLAAVVLAASVASAQDMAQITEIYNNGAAALSNGEKASALESFKQALSLAEAIGDEGKDVVANCKNVIPTISLSMAKDLVKAGDYDSAVSSLKDVVELANKYEAADVAQEAENLIPQVVMTKAGKLLNSKDFAGAAEAYKAVLELQPTNGMAALRLGAALNSTGDIDGALAAFDIAKANGQEAQVNKQLSTIYLKQAAAALKAKNYAGAVEAAGKVNAIADNAQAYQIAGQASQLSGKNADAIAYFEKYLELSPNAKNAGQIYLTVGALYQQVKNNAKAKEFYTKAKEAGVPDAQKYIDACK